MDATECELEQLPEADDMARPDVDGRRDAHRASALELAPSLSEREKRYEAAEARRLEQAAKRLDDEVANARAVVSEAVRAAAAMGPVPSSGVRTQTSWIEPRFRGPYCC